MDYLNSFGLVANLVGALLLAFSIKVVDPAKNFGAGASIKIGGTSLTITVPNKKRLKVGAIILIAGFVLQLISQFV